MNKKLMAIAVAGALAAPALAYAQASTVQIYGVVNAEYGINVQQPNNAATPSIARHDAETLNSSPSRIGFRSEEALGNDLSAFFQCESDLRFLASTTNGPSGTGLDTTSGTLCDRNSTIGLRDDFGSLFIGSWDSPIKKTSAVTRITNESG